MALFHRDSLGFTAMGTFHNPEHTLYQLLNYQNVDMTLLTLSDLGDMISR